MKTQVLIYTSYLHTIGGIETFVLSFCKLMSPYYDIAVYCPKCPAGLHVRLARLVQVITEQEPIECDTLVMIRVMEDIPKNITYKKSVRMCHACRARQEWYVKDDCDKLVHVSKASKESFETDGNVILNPVIKNDDKALLLVSATRIPAPDKGRNQDRMIKLAEMLTAAGIRFLWLNFSDSPLRDSPKNIVNVGEFEELQPYIAKADYLVQLSDAEGFCYSVAEALVSGTAVICTPFETTKELGVEDGVNGYIVPFDMNFDVTRLLTVPTGWSYTWDNEPIEAKWKKLLGKSSPTHSYAPQELVQVLVTRGYNDTQLLRFVRHGEVLSVPRDRADLICGAGFGELI